MPKLKPTRSQLLCGELKRLIREKKAGWELTYPEASQGIYRSQDGLKRRLAHMQNMNIVELQRLTQRFKMKDEVIELLQKYL